ncbi:MAG: deoxyribodipyrimidine photo-lyase [Imperialibacter sp.]|uniref:cryptochrome/photolyase family protein n=1 Tax=Imperialibacter sp. TaxID=2038411 RepID=UPI0032EDD0C2
MPDQAIAIFWFRRDLRFEDNAGLYHAMKADLPVLPLFIFDKHILDDLEDKNDARVMFLHDTLSAMHDRLGEKGSSLLIRHGTPQQVWKDILKDYPVKAVYTNHDYEPYARERDETINQLLTKHDIPFRTYKDQVIFEKDEVLTNSGGYYKVFTPYKNAWLSQLSDSLLEPYTSALSFDNWYQTKALGLPSLPDLGFERADIEIPPNRIDEETIDHYDKTRDYPALDGTSRLGIHLRHGTLSIRKLTRKAKEMNQTYLNELIWREFYMQILFHAPQVVDTSFKPKYDRIPWRNDEDEFERWCTGTTGYPIVDAGMRELNKIGYMHNRVRMITASFLTKHLLIDWRWGEAYFAKKLLDYELANNNGGWQWAAGSGVDAQPYFRVFNPYSQADKFDKEEEYIKKWVPEYGTDDYPEPMVDHKEARERAINTYKKALNQ